MKRHLAGTLVVVLLVSSVAASIGPLGVAAQSSSTVRGSPNLSTTLPDSSVAPGQTNQVTIQISNDGELTSGVSSQRSIVTTARNVRLEADADGTPLTVETGELALGSITEDQPREASIAVTVPEDVEAGTYTIDVDLRYSYTSLQSNGSTFETSGREFTEVEVEVEDAPRFSIVNATTDAAIGESGSLSLTLENTGSQTAYDVQPVVESTSQGVAFGQSNADTGHVDSIDPGETVTVTYDVQVSPDARVRSYPISTTVRFEDPDGVERSEPNLSAGITPLPEQTFDVSNVTTDLRVNEQGTFEATVANEGPRSVRNAVVALQSGTPNVEIPTPTQSVGNLEPGEQRTVDFDVNVGAAVTAGTQQFDLVVNYTNDEGDRYPSDTIETNATIRPRQDRFDVERTSADLRVNEEGSLELTIVNNGSETVRNPVATLETTNQNVHVNTPEYALPDLAPGEETSLSYEVDVSSSMAASVQQFDVTVRYTDSDGDRRSSEPVETNVRIRPERDRFAVEPVNGTVSTGESTALRLRVTNNGNETVRNVEAKAFLDDPLSSSDDEALIPELEPGDSSEIVIEVGAAGSALAKTYPVSMDFQYELPDGDTELSRTYKIPVTVTEGEGGGLPIWIAVPILGVLVVIGWQRERLRSYFS